MGKKLSERGQSVEDADEWTRVAMKMSYKFLRDENSSAWATWVSLNCYIDQLTPHIYFEYRGKVWTEHGLECFGGETPYTRREVDEYLEALEH